MELYEDLSGPFLHMLKARAVFSDVYRFFDVTIAVKSDGKELLDWFRYFYRRFRIEEADDKIDITYYIMVQASEGPLIFQEENSHSKVRLLDNVYSATVYMHLLVLEYILANLKSHFLLHGAAVSRNADGLAIMAPSGSGKTVLTLQLVLREGFGFLSDDQVAIDRRTHLISPFPRSIGIRETSLPLFDELELEHLKPREILGGKRKWFVDISEISEKDVGKPCPLKYLVFLVNSANETENGEQRIELILDDPNEELMQELPSLARGGEIHHMRVGGHHVLSFYPELETTSPLDVERLCRNCGIWFFGVREVSSVKPEFHKTPEIQPIAWHAAAMELLKGLGNDLRSHSPGSVFMELASLLENVECYKLSIGKLAEMAEHVCGLMSDS